MQPDHSVTPEEYLALEAEAEVRHEYWYGRVVAMAGETYNHNAVKDDLVNALRRLSDCDVLSSGLRVRAPGYGRDNYTYPDAVVMCTPKQFDETTRPPTLLNPTVLIEVTSDSTGNRDSTDKLDAYFQLDSLLEYWIVDPDRPLALHFVRSDGGDLVHFVRGLDQTLGSDALGVAIPMREIYRRVLL